MAVRRLGLLHRQWRPDRAFRTRSPRRRSGADRTGASAETLVISLRLRRLSPRRHDRRLALLAGSHSDGSDGSNGQLGAYDADSDQRRIEACVVVLDRSRRNSRCRRQRVAASMWHRDGLLYAFGRPASVALTGQRGGVGQVAVGSSANGTAISRRQRTINVNRPQPARRFAVDVPCVGPRPECRDTLAAVTFRRRRPARPRRPIVSTDIGPVTLDLHGTGTKRVCCSAQPAGLRNGGHVHDEDAGRQHHNTAVG